MCFRSDSMLPMTASPSHSQSSCGRHQPASSQLLVWTGAPKNLAQKEFFITLGGRGRVCLGSQVTQAQRLPTWVTSSWP